MPLLVALALVPALSAQTTRVEFDVVSIKRSAENAVAMFADRMKLVAHVVERELDTFALVLARRTTMEALVLSIAGLARRQVFDRTGLQGNYSLTLKFSPPRAPGTTSDAPRPDDAPEFVTALQEQLG